ncbi:hypothetical protein [Desulfogranum mediterraneum]|uniref:hypothetical protein n=1 Tax=Desulfogranum mediterraneum TaxID=160661 RepID=UPI00048E767E|nr:hypothetical protein [Desulfogranum mediterraneum]
MDVAYLVDISYMIYLSANEVDFEPVSNEEYVYQSQKEAKEAALGYDLHQHKQGLLDRLKIDKGRIAVDVITIKDGEIEDSILMKSLECTVSEGLPKWIEK